MIEINGQVFYRAVKMIAAMNDECRLKFEQGSTGVSTIVLDTGNVMMQLVTLDVSVLTDYREGFESGKELAIDISMIVPFVKANKKADWFRLEFFENIEGKNLHKVMLTAHTKDGEPYITFDTLDVHTVRRMPNKPRLSIDSSFTTTIKDIKNYIKLVGPTNKEPTVGFIIDNGILHIDCYERSTCTGIKCEGNARTKYDNRLLGKFLSAAESKDTILFEYKTDHPAMITNKSCGFENLYLIAPRISTVD